MYPLPRKTSKPQFFFLEKRYSDERKQKKKNEEKANPPFFILLSSRLIFFDVFDDPLAYFLRSIVFATFYLDFGCADTGIEGSIDSLAD